MSQNITSNIDREIEATLEKILNYIFKSLWHGIKRLKVKSNAIIFVVLIVAAVMTIKFADTLPKHFKIAYILPFIFLWGIGLVQNYKFQKQMNLLKEINFVGADGKFPIMIGEQSRDRVTEMIFTSNIPLSVWTKNKEILETALDRTIIHIRQGQSKKNVVVSCLPAGFKFPEKILWKDEYISDKDGEILLGEDAFGPIKFNLNKIPHVLSAGETGSGKSVILRCIMWQLLNKGCRAYMIDFKGGVEFGIDYEKYGEVIMERERALEILDMLVAENKLRLDLFRQMRVKNLPEYNLKNNKNLCRIVLVVDEISEMLDKKGADKETKTIMEQLEGRLSTLARLSRATGIDIILGTQRPSADVLPGQIKNNIPVRICGRLADGSASEIVLGNRMAEQLPQIPGRFMYRIGADTLMFQSYYFDDDTMLKEIKVKKGDLLLEKKNKKSKGVIDPEEIKKPLKKINFGDGDEAIEFVSKKSEEKTKQKKTE